MKLRLLYSYAAPHRGPLAFSAAIMLAESGAALATPWIAGRFAQEILAGNTAGELVLGLIALLAIQAVLSFWSGCIVARTSALLLADLRVRIYDHLQALPLGFHHQRRQGDVLTLITHEAVQLANFITSTALGIAPLVVTTVGALVIMTRIEPMLAVAAAVLLPIFYFVLKIAGRRLRPLARQMQQANADAVAVANENLGMLLAVKTFTRELRETERYAGHVETAMALGLRQQRLSSAFKQAVGFVSTSAAVLLVWVASRQIGTGHMNTADLVSFVLYAGLLTRPISAMAGLYGQVLMARGTLERLHDVLGEVPEPIRRAGRNFHHVRGEIEYRNVSFAYPGRDPALSNLNLHIRAGETIAVTGENGAGKSTLAHLLLRLYEPASGQILLDGVDISTAGLHNLRAQIGVVPQHVMLFHGTVRENIEYGRPGAASGAIEHAARLAQAHAFICDLPDGYDTVIGDEGVRLSGGQRQRIALARALVKDPPVLVLDEATAMFDPEGERSFIAECRDELASRTVILITHRPASLALADRIVKIESGRVIVIREKHAGLVAEPA